MSLLWLQKNRIVENGRIYLCDYCPCYVFEDTWCLCSPCHMCLTMTCLVHIDSESYYAIISLQNTGTVECPSYRLLNTGDVYLYRRTNRSRTNMLLKFNVVVLSTSVIFYDIVVTENDLIEGTTLRTANNAIIEGSLGHGCFPWGRVFTFKDNRFLCLIGDMYTTNVTLHNVGDELENSSIYFNLWFGGPYGECSKLPFPPNPYLHVNGIPYLLTAHPANDYYFANVNGTTHYVTIDSDTDNLNIRTGSYAIYGNSISYENILAHKNDHCGGPVGKYGAYEVTE